MLVECRRSLEERCPRGWGLATLAAGLVVVSAAGTYGEAPQKPAQNRPKRQASAPTGEASPEQPKSETAPAAASGGEVQPADSPRQPRVAKEQLRYSGRTFDDWRQQLFTDLDPKKREEAIRALQAFGLNGYGPEAAAAIGEVLASGDSNVSNAAFQSLGRLGSAAVPVLSSALESSEHVSAAALALGNIGPAAADAMPALVAAAERAEEQNDQQSLGFALAAIGIGDDALTAPLTDMLQNGDYLLRVAMLGQACYWRKHVPEHLAPLLLAAVRDPDAEIRTAAGQGLARVASSDEVVAILQSLMHEDVQQVTSNVLSTLTNGTANPDTAIAALSDVLASEDLRREFANALQNVVQYLGRLGPRAKPAVPGLMEVIRSEANLVTLQSLQSAADALGSIGPAAEAAAPALRERLEEIRDGETRRHLAAALKRIEGGVGD